MNENILATEFYGNPLGEYGLSALILFGGSLLAIVAYQVSKRSMSKNDAFEKSGGWATKLLFAPAVVGIIYAAFFRLSMPDEMRRLLTAVATIVFTFSVIRVVVRLLRTGMDGFFDRRSTDAEIRRLRPIRNLLGFLIWAIGLIFLLDNLGFDISAIVAGIGVSGIAVAIAAQGILGDLFNYFVILLDKPFEVGDFILFDDKMGTVVKIGVKTTRLRVPGGEELVVSNSSLATSRIHNFRLLERRLVVFEIKLAYGIPPETLEAIPDMVRAVVDGVNLAEFQRCHLTNLGQYGIEFEIVFYVNSADYVTYMDARQTINLGILAKLGDMGAEITTLPGFMSG